MGNSYNEVLARSWKSEQEKPKKAEQAAAPTKGPLRKVPVNRPESSKVKEIVIQV